MSLDSDISSDKKEREFNDSLSQQNLATLDKLKYDIFSKREIVSEFRTKFNKRFIGKYTSKLLNELIQIEAEYSDLYENLDNKLILYIIGNDNVGKSTLLNALIGYEVTNINSIKNTWRIDIFSSDLEKDTAIIKYVDGKTEKLPIDKVKEKIHHEEIKIEEGRKNFFENREKQLNGLGIKDDFEEMEKFLVEKYIYKSNILEIVWPAEKKWILDNCILVDTISINSNSLENRGNIEKFYYKADGVLWLLDGQEIMDDNGSIQLTELNYAMQKLGCLKENMVGVINKIDLVEMDYKEEEISKALNNVKNMFKDKFSDLISISAKKGIYGLTNKKSSIVASSGILDLEKAIRDIFISKSKIMKINAKKQRYNKLYQLTLNISEKYYSKVIDFYKMYSEKEEELLSYKEKLTFDIGKEVDRFFESYLQEVSERVDIHINALAEGKEVSFVKDTMYRLDEFIKSRGVFIDKKQLQIKSNAIIWEKFSNISAYKFIQNSKVLMEDNILVNENINLSSLNNITYFTPTLEEDLLKDLRDICGKTILDIRKESVKKKINSSIRRECNKMKKDIFKKFKINIEKNFIYCKDVKDITFKDILFDYKDIESVIGDIKEFELKMKK